MLPLQHRQSGVSQKMRDSHRDRKFTRLNENPTQKTIFPEVNKEGFSLARQTNLTAYRIFLFVASRRQTRFLTWLQLS
jgi:hypothetical protein